jgi:hypothetical protein
LVDGVEFKVLDPRSEVYNSLITWRGFDVGSAGRYSSMWYAVGYADASGYPNAAGVTIDNWTKEGSLYTFSLPINPVTASGETKFKVILREPFGGAVIGISSDAGNNASEDPWVNLSSTANNTWQYV